MNNLAEKEIVEPVDTWEDTYRRKTVVIELDIGRYAEASIFVAQRYSNSQPKGELQLSLTVNKSDSRSSFDLSPSQMRELAANLISMANYLEELTILKEGGAK